MLVSLNKIYENKLFQRISNHPLIASLFIFLFSISIFITLFLFDELGDTNIHVLISIYVLILGDRFVWSVTKFYDEAEKRKNLQAEETVKNILQSSIDLQRKRSDEYVEGVNLKLNKLEKTINDTVNIFMKKTFLIESHGHAEDIYEELYVKILNAKNVYNTFVGIDRSPEYGSLQYDKIRQTYEDWLAKNDKGCWHDIVGIEEFFSSRYRNIKKMDVHAEHRVYVLRNTAIALNFLILEYPDYSKEVIFGWLPEGDSGENSEIYSTRNIDIVGTFEKYFKNLRKKTWCAKANAGPVGYSINYSLPSDQRLNAHQEGLVDKVGIWATSNFELMDNSFEKIEKKGIGFIDFSSNTSGLVIKSKIYNLDMENVEPLGSYKFVGHYLNVVFISYSISNNGPNGFCYYQFFRLDGRDFVVGSYFDERSRNNNYFIGLRIDHIVNNIQDTEDRALFRSILEYTEKNIPEKKRLIDIFRSGYIG